MKSSVYWIDLSKQLIKISHREKLRGGSAIYGPAATPCSHPINMSYIALMHQEERLRSHKSYGYQEEASVCSILSFKGTISKCEGCRRHGTLVVGAGLCAEGMLQAASGMQSAHNTQRSSIRSCGQAPSIAMRQHAHSSLTPSTP